MHNYIRVSYENCQFMNTNVDNEKLKAFFTFYPEQLVFIQNKDEKIIGIVSMSDFQKGFSIGRVCINNNFQKIVLHSDYLEEVKRFFEETKYQFVPVIGGDGRLIEYFRKRSSINLENYYDENPELLIGRWLDIKNTHLVKLVKSKKFNRIKICIINELSEYVYDYFKYYEFYFESVEKIFWYDVAKVKEDEMLIIDRTRKLYVNINAVVYPLAVLQTELEFNLLLGRCKKYDAKLYFVSYPTIHNISNITREEKERIGKNMFWTEYLENAKIYSELLEQVLGMKDDERDSFIRSCLNLPSVIVKGQLCYQCEFTSKYVNVVGGNRVTTNMPKHIRNSVYIAGNSFVFGALVDDEHTISSLLQKKLNQNENMKNYFAINEGIRGVPFCESIKRLNQDTLQKDDIVVLFIDIERLLKSVGNDVAASILKNIDIYHLEDVFNRLDRNKIESYFIESPIHPNAFGYQITADYLMKIFEESYNDSWKNRVIIDESLIIEEGKECFGTEDELKHYIQEIKVNKQENGKNGSIVMNCNPLTYGHKYLIEYASKLVDHLYIFVVQEDRSAFSFAERFEMVSACAEEYSNVTVVPSGKFIISTFTFAEYFTKQEADPHTVVDTSRDIDIFGKYIAPALNITVRFAGEEPTDHITAQYNQSMKIILPKYGVEFIEIPRFRDNSEFISATKVRKALKSKNFDIVRRLVPKTTYQILLKKYY